LSKGEAMAKSKIVGAKVKKKLLSAYVKVANHEYAERQTRVYGSFSNYVDHLIDKDKSRYMGKRD
jgi:hypothetical protein